MNTRKLALALRLAAEALLEGENDTAPPPSPAPAMPEPTEAPRRRGKRAPYVPPGPVDDVTRQRAVRRLSKLGMVGLK